MLDTVFAENVTVKLLVKKDFVGDLLKKLTDISGGNISFEQLDERFDNFA